MSEGKLFFGGVPVGPDVEKLRKAIKAEAGLVIRHSDIAKVISEDPKASRYRTIIASWRKTVEREQFLRIEAEVGIGYRVLTPEQAVSRSSKDIELMSNASRKATVRVEMIDTVALPDQIKSQHALVRRHAHMINDTFRQVRKEIAAPEPTKAALQVVK